MTSEHHPKKPWTDPHLVRLDQSVADATKVAPFIFLPGPEGVTYHGSASFNYSVVYTYQS